MFKKEKTISNEGGVPATATLTSHSGYWLTGFKHTYIYTDDNSTATNDVEGTFTVDTNREIGLKSERISGVFPEIGTMAIDTSKENKGVVLNGSYRFTVVEENASIFWKVTNDVVIG